MARYHINPKTGKPGVCRATKSCPFGDMEADHYPSVAAAQAAFEEAMHTSVTPPASKLTPQFTVALSELMDPELVLRMRAEGFLDVREHEDDPSLKVMCYSKLTQQAGMWNDVTKNARGLIVRAEEEDLSDAVVVERPWKKFFTLEQMESGWHLGDEEGGSAGDDELARLDLSAAAEVTDKMDGSMGILYRHPDGAPALATKGSFGSDQANYYTRMLRNTELGEQADNLLSRDRDKTFLFEMVGRENRIVLDYPADGIVLLGAVQKDTGVYLSANDYASRWGGGVTETMNASTVAEALALPDRPEREGVVIRVLSSDPAKQMQLKVKQDDYKMLHRAVTGFSVSDMRASIRDSGDSLEDLVAVAKSGDVTQLRGVAAQLEILDAHPLLSGVRDERAEAYERLIMPRLTALTEAKERVDSLSEETVKGPGAAKSFAASIAQEPPQLKADLFAFFQARASDRPLSTVGGLNVLRQIAHTINPSSVRSFEE